RARARGAGRVRSRRHRQPRRARRPHRPAAARRGPARRSPSRSEPREVALPSAPSRRHRRWAARPQLAVWSLRQGRVDQGGIFMKRLATSRRARWLVVVLAIAGLATVAAVPVAALKPADLTFTPKSESDFTNIDVARAWAKNYYGAPTAIAGSGATGTWAT